MNETGKSPEEGFLAQRRREYQDFLEEHLRRAAADLGWGEPKSSRPEDGPAGTEPEGGGDSAAPPASDGPQDPDPPEAEETARELRSLREELEALRRTQRRLGRGALALLGVWTAAEVLPGVAGALRGLGRFLGSQYAAAAAALAVRPQELTAILGGLAGTLLLLALGVRYGGRLGQMLEQLAREDRESGGGR